MSRAASVLGLCGLSIIAVTYIIQREYETILFVVLGGLFMFVNSVRGTFAFHKYMRREDVGH